MTETLNPSSACDSHRDTSCNLCGSTDICPPCEMNEWLLSHQCEWCGVVAVRPTKVKGRILCSSTICEWLLFELLGREKT